MTKKENILSQIDSWLKDYELATDDCYGDDDTLDGSAYNLLLEVRGFIKKS